MPTYLPSREADLVTWSANMSTLINADPTSYGLTLTQASDYAALQTAYANAYTTANNDSTRTTPAIVAKNNAKQALIVSTRQLVDIIQAYPGTTDQMRADLQITIRDTEPTPIDPPTTPPSISVVSRYDRTVTLRIFDGTNPTSRAKPENVQGAAIFSYVGDDAPTTNEQWKFEHQATRNPVTITFPESVPHGSRVWFTAYWYIAKGDSSPALYPPISCYLDSGEAVEAA